MKKIALLFSLGILFVSCNSSSESESHDSTVVSSDSVASAVSSVEGSSKDCYLFVEGKDSTKVSLVIDGENVSGEMFWLPNEKDGATGTLQGKKVGNELKVDYNYVIEGSNQVEEKIFELKDGKLLEKSGELEDKNGKLVLKDPSKIEVRTILNKVNCE